jgi:hypothetical protein
MILMHVDDFNIAGTRKFVDRFVAATFICNNTGEGVTKRVKDIYDGER